MRLMNHFLNWKELVGSRVRSFTKHLGQGEQMMVGLKLLEPNQAQDKLAHPGADKFILC